MTRFIIDGNAVYEIDEVCMQKRRKRMTEDKTKETDQKKEQEKEKSS
ncbi:MAG: hypothetical protein PHQ72_07430 [Hespellia sp.]|nr:hypothetical protein [Hespellia sp.]